MNLKKKQEQPVPAAEEAKPAEKAEPRAPKKKKPARKKLIIILAAVVIVIVAGLLIWGGPLGVRMETVSAAPFSDTFTETGVVKGGTAREHISPAAGKVEEVLVRKNSAVRAGDVLVRLAATELEYELESHRNAWDNCRAQVTESIRSLRAELSELQAARSQNTYDTATELSPEAYLESLRAKAQVAQSQLELAESELNTARELYALGAESKVGVEEAEKAYQEALAQSQELSRQYAEASARFAGGGNGAYYGAHDQSYATRIEAIRQQLEEYEALAAIEDYEGADYGTSSLGRQMAEEASRIRQLEEKLDRCTVRALCDGIVSELPAETLSDVSEGENLATVRESAALTLEVNVLTSEEPFLRVGDSVVLTHKLKGAQTTYEGAITEIAGYAEKRVSATGADEYRVRVVVGVPENQGLKDGYELEARFTTYHSDTALTVPSTALFKVDGQDCVFVVSGLQAQQRNVTVVHKATARAEIGEGLSEGERVIADANQEGLEDGSLVISSD